MTLAGVDIPDKVFGVADLKNHTSEKSCWIVVHGKVYDVTEFLEEHPGGYDIILTVTGRDATRDFDEIGHSNSAKKLLEKYLIGSFEGGDPVPMEQVAPPLHVQSKAAATEISLLRRIISVLLPVFLLIVAVALNSFPKSKAA
ncbi:hypothetical protein CEUSTIGMA_g3949.t1 [Chlamydomonas eustigma]|uniref:Cytochrome b5 heme-binding domain-containing protein n=1 Tax=Chlamydomonas eustigma TaxID=1157962 RepID=A0A250X083_9CHLO|nr:hypothetical protein CEUSTIGMA_g3949.t1 [Chlamydomonas eustigma]|eukprot:GAX76504.1 hypothetical protein CEUSTIGMA_g3949.t1 [Chlamydomonas eustigma]